MPTPLDERDLRITECLVRNPSTTVDVLADLVSIPEPTVQRRLTELMREGHIARTIQIKNWSAIGYPLRVLILVEVHQRELKLGRGGPPDDEATVKTQKDLAMYIKNRSPLKFKGDLFVQEVAILLGQNADLAVTVRAKNQEVVLDFVTNALRVLGGVSRTLTSFGPWSTEDSNI